MSVHTSNYRSKDGARVKEFISPVRKHGISIKVTFYLEASGSGCLRQRINLSHSAVLSTTTDVDDSPRSLQ